VTRELLLPGAIDVHAHYLTPAYRQALLDAGEGKADGMPGLPEWSAPEALRLMDELGIASAVLSVSSPGVHFGDDAAARSLSRLVNDEGAGFVAAHPSRFGLLATLPLPDVDGALAEIDHAFDELGVDGVVLETNYRGVYPSDPALEPVLAALDARNAVVLLHPTSPCGWEALSFGRPRPLVEFPFDTTRAVLDLVFKGCLTRFPGIRFIIPHTGGVLPMVADRAQVLGGALGLEGSPADVVGALRELYYDVAGAALPRALPALLTLVGHDRLLYGGDGPFTPEPAIRKMAADLARSDVFTAEQRAAMLHGTAATLFPRLAKA
jgi:predicted TIM-barrel fold metal-dependent hydrolase